MKFKELTFTNNYIFAKVMLNKALCKIFLAIICGIKIDTIRYIQMEKVIENAYDAKGIRLDICVIDEEGNYYNIEMQTTDLGNIPERIRYYWGAIDRAQLPKGHDYSELRKNGYVIFVCLDDIRGNNIPIESFEVRSTYDGSLLTNQKAIILNAACTELPDNALGNFLRFVKTGIPTDDFTRKLLCEVDNVKRNKDWEAEYKVLEDMLRESRKEGNAEGQKKLQKLLKKIPKESEDFEIALDASSDKLEELYKKYEIHSED